MAAIVASVGNNDSQEGQFAAAYRNAKITCHYSIKLTRTNLEWTFFQGRWYFPMSSSFFFSPEKLLVQRLMSKLLLKFEIHWNIWKRFLEYIPQPPALLLTQETPPPTLCLRENQKVSTPVTKQLFIKEIKQVITCGSWTWSTNVPKRLMYAFLSSENNGSLICCLLYWVRHYNHCSCNHAICSFLKGH